MAGNITMLELFRREISGSFYSWRGGAWIVAASLIFSLVAYLLLTDNELSLLDQVEMLFILGEVIVALGVVMSAASASSAISSEMESGTLESILLTPIKHSHIAMQKLISVLYVWAMLYVVSIPYLVVVSSGTNLSLSAIFYVGVYGTILVIAVSSLSIALSAKLKSSKSSMMSALMIVLILLSPPLFFATSLQKTDFGLVLQNINPMSHAINSLDNVLVDNEQVLSQQVSHIWPVVVFAFICISLFIWFTRKFEVKGTAE
jgi:ABC-type transport system involved in cytochrome c biogenesis permease component